MMKSMKPEDLERMTSQMGQGPAGGGKPAAMDMSQMLKDPGSMRSMMSSMQAMSEDDLVGMLKMTKPNLTDEEARVCGFASCS
jgi:hypothetical protein